MSYTGLGAKLTNVRSRCPDILKVVAARQKYFGAINNYCIAQASNGISAATYWKNQALAAYRSAHELSCYLSHCNSLGYAPGWMLSEQDAPVVRDKCLCAPRTQCDVTKGLAVERDIRAKCFTFPSAGGAARVSQVPPAAPTFVRATFPRFR